MAVIAMESQFEMSVRAMLAREPFRYRGVSEEDLRLYCRALTHDSAGDGKPVESYERLEFLGDAVLELIACEEAYRSDAPDEGAMTDIKQDWVANERISERVLAHGLDIDGVMRVGGGHVDRDGRHVLSDNMRADCFEALLAVVYLTRGLEEARRIAREVVLPRHPEERPRSVPGFAFLGGRFPGFPHIRQEIRISQQVQGLQDRLPLVPGQHDDVALLRRYRDDIPFQGPVREFVQTSVGLCDVHQCHERDYRYHM